MKLFEAAVKRFAGIAADNIMRAENLIKKARTPIEIVACKYVAQYRHSETMKLIRKMEREINKNRETNKK
ncbi:MAG: hypothetical protein PHH77_05200 [Victivallaceae bacterium]|nr:hypothetical protein [Victivallaceae bacterium]